MPNIQDGPQSALFTPIEFKGNVPLANLAGIGITKKMAAALEHAPEGECVSWGMPFAIREVIALTDQAVIVDFRPTTARWIVFLHTSDVRQVEPRASGLISPMRGEGQLAEHAANYVMLYADGTETSVAIRRRHQIGMFQRRWGENCFEAVAHRKPYPIHPAHEQLHPGWGWTQTRVNSGDGGEWVNWLWAWENPAPDKAVAGVRFEPKTGIVIVSAISAGNVATLPLRWQPRRKVCLRLPGEDAFLPDLDEEGLLPQIQLDLGQVISVTPRPLYPNDQWAATANNQIPPQSPHEILVEYTAHPNACFYLSDGQMIPVAQVEKQSLAVNLPAISESTGPDAPAALYAMPPAVQRVTLRVVESGSNTPVPVKLHVHGTWGEYLAPADRHRQPNPAWFEDYSVDFIHLQDPGLAFSGAYSEPFRAHTSTYISGVTTLDVPLGQVFLEISKGFEIHPVRKTVTITPETQELVIEIEKVLPWREHGWVTADTHVHFLSPMSALLEGSAEGVNVINLLASQWGELMTNVGDFDGKTTWGSKEAGGDGEYLVRVGTENRQHVLGHISLLGYRGQIIAPMTTGGPDEAALGDPIEILLTEWARQCKQQGGLVVVPHFPNPRAEHAASIVSGEIDAVEMTSWGVVYGGIDPYSLSDWYRYLNCGYLVAAVGGTDKMSAGMAVGTVRTYARLAPHALFTYETWMDAVRRAETFVTYGPLLDFAVDGQPMGSRIEMSATGGTGDVTWRVASVTIPMSRVELIVNGEIRESLAVAPYEQQGHWSIKVDQSSWLALLVRGHYADKPEIIAAHSSPVFVNVAGSPLLAAADAVTILEQIEGARAYLDTIGTRADDMTHKRMRLVLTAAQRSLHNRMHQAGQYHHHTPVDDHPEHH